MQFLQHASSSAGNMYEIKSSCGKRILVECGLSWRKTQAALDFDFSGIEAVLLTHAHNDHSCCYEKMTENGIDVYATHDTVNILPPVKRYRRMKQIIVDHKITIGPFVVTPFSTHHDIEGSCGFIIQQDKEAILFCTDSTHISEAWDIPFTAIAIEASWDRKAIDFMVKDGTVNSFYAKRLESTHMERQHTMLYIRDYCNISKCREIHLIHMSSTMDKAAVKAEFEDEFMIPVFIKE